MHDEPNRGDKMEAFYILLVIGVLTALFGAQAIFARMRFAQTAIKARGRVVDVKSGMKGTGFSDMDGRRELKEMYQAVIEFSTKSGQRVQFRRLATSVRPTQGQHVEVLYNPRNPSEAVELDLIPVTFGPIMVTTIGAAIALGSLYFVFNPPQSTEQPATGAGLNHFGKTGKKP
jgi:hypothetical protein